MNCKKFSIGLISSLLILPMVALANDILVTDHTKNHLSFKVNGKCREDFGTVSPGQSITINKNALKEACGNNETLCDVLVYNDIACGGEHVAIMHVYPSSGIKEVCMTPGSNYSVTYNPYLVIYTAPLSTKS